jgi:hypothetical protein
VSGPTESAELDRIVCFGDGAFAIVVLLDERWYRSLGGAFG